MSISNCHFIELPKISDSRGNLTFVEGGNHIPFELRRVFYLYDVPVGAERGGHSHKASEQFLIAISGSFDLIIDDAHGKMLVHLSRPNQGFHVCPMVWCELGNFSKDAVCMVLTSDKFDENDYVRDYREYCDAVGVMK